MSFAKPLAGKRFVNTRAEHQSAELSALIRASGGIPLHYPCIAIEPPADSAELEEGLQQLAMGQWAWLVLTSVNTVYALAPRWQNRPTYPFRVAAIGTATAKAASEQLGVQVELLPEHASAEALAQTLLHNHCPSVFLPHSALAHPTLAKYLQAGGVLVKSTTAYQTVCGRGGVELPSLWRSVDGVAFTSSSTVSCFLARWQAESGGVPLVTEGVCWASIGRKTMESAEKQGLPITVTALNQTIDSLLQAIILHFANR